MAPRKTRTTTRRKIQKPTDSWKDSEKNKSGVPYCFIAPTWLSKDGEKKLFATQSAVDEAWKDGWHDSTHPTLTRA